MYKPNRANSREIMFLNEGEEKLSSESLWVEKNKWGGGGGEKKFLQAYFINDLKGYKALVSK